MVNLKKSQSHRNKELVGGCQGLGSSRKWGDVGQRVQA